MTSLTLEPGLKVYTTSQINEEMEEKQNADYVGENEKQWNDHPFLVDLFGKKILDSTPHISVKSGGTDYLDIIKPRDFVDKNGKNVHMVKGIDRFDRHFVSFGFKMKNIETDKEEFSIYTIFRRYTDPNGGWVICKSHYSESLGHDLGIALGQEGSAWLQEKTKENIKKLVEEYDENGFSRINSNISEWDSNKKEYVEKEVIISLYCPASRNE